MVSHPEFLKGQGLIADQARTPAYTVDLRRYALHLHYSVIIYVCQSFVEESGIEVVIYLILFVSVCRAGD